MTYFDAASILFEDENFLVVIKPPGLPIQPTKGQRTNLLNLIEDYFEFKRGIETPYIGLVHRLDQPTGGLVVFTKNPQMTTSFNKALQAHKIQKYYLALCEGIFNESSGSLRHYLTIDQKKNFVKAHDQSIPEAKEAILHYEVVGRKNIDGKTCSLIKVDLESGRQHQIRVQFSQIGHPLIGDQKYGSADGQTPLMLWAYEMHFKIKGRTYDFIAKPLDPLLQF